MDKEDCLLNTIFVSPKHPIAIHYASAHFYEQHKLLKLTKKLATLYLFSLNTAQIYSS